MKMGMIMRNVKGTSAPTLYALVAPPSGTLLRSIASSDNQFQARLDVGIRATKKVKKKDFTNLKTNKNT